MRGKQGRDPIEAIWALFCSIRFAVALNISLALAAMVGTVIPQMPIGIQNFPIEFERFLEGSRGRFGDFAGVMHWSGLFDFYNSLPFRLLVAFVVFGIVVCTLNRWQPIMRLINQPAVKVGVNFISSLSEKAEFRAVPLNPEVATDVLHRVLKKGHYRVLHVEDSSGSTTHLYADKDRWSKLVTFVSHAALVMFIVVAAGMMNMGWREQSVIFNPGQSVNVGHGTQFEVRNDNFWIDYYPDGKTIKEYKNTLTVIEGGKEVLSKTIIVNDPLRYKDIIFFLVSYQPVLRAYVGGDNGSRVPLRRMGSDGPPESDTGTEGTLVEFKFVSAENVPMDLLQFTAGEQIVTLELTYYQDVERAEGENPPVYVRAFRDKEFEKPFYDAFMPRTGKFALPGYEGYTIRFDKETATILEVATDPGLGPAAFFFGLMGMGFTISLYTSFTRFWAQVTPNLERPGTVNIVIGGLAEKNKVSFEREFERIATRARDLLADVSRDAGDKAGAASTPLVEAGSRQ